MTWVTVETSSAWMVRPSAKWPSRLARSHTMTVDCRKEVNSLVTMIASDHPPTNPSRQGCPLTWQLFPVEVLRRTKSPGWHHASFERPIQRRPGHNRPCCLNEGSTWQHPAGLVKQHQALLQEHHGVLCFVNISASVPRLHEPVIDF